MLTCLIYLIETKKNKTSIKDQNPKLPNKNTKQAKMAPNLTIEIPVSSPWINAPDTPHWEDIKNSAWVDEVINRDITPTSPSYYTPTSPTWEEIQSVSLSFAGIETASTV